MEKHFKRLIAGALVFVSIAFIFSCTKPEDRQRKKPVPVPDLIRKQVELMGEPRVERISGHVWAAIGYDLANVVLIDTGDGVVVVDTAMSPARAGLIKDAFEASDAPKGKVLAVVYTHSHIDHIGGTSVWMKEGTKIWATEAFTEHMLNQYERFLPIETMRARRQFGDHISKDDLPIHGLGPRMDISAAKESGVRLPTHTFSGAKTLVIGGLEMELVEAHGETHDHLFIWIPADRTLIAGDNFYYTFPNLYTIRGSSPRPVDAWIASIDAMRAKEPEHLIPGHTIPVHGREKILDVLTDYRDAIQWVRDEVIRGANRGLDMDTLAETIELPPHLADLDVTREYYGQVDWSVRAIYNNHLGWFDGRPEELYPLPRKELASREVGLMGGPERVGEMADAAMEEGDPRWAVHLLSKLKYSGLTPAGGYGLDEKLARAYEALAAETYNLNGRAYLLESAYELRNGIEKPAPAKLDEEMVQSIPLDMIFSVMTSKLIPEKAMDVHETVHFVFPDEDRKFIMTVRRGIAEVSVDRPMPGTPEPVATFIADAETYRRIAIQDMSPAKALAEGKLKVEGSWLGFIKFMGMFDRSK